MVQRRGLVAGGRVWKAGRLRQSPRLVSLREGKGLDMMTHTWPLV